MQTIVLEDGTTAYWWWIGEKIAIHNTQGIFIGTVPTGTTVNEVYLRKQAALPSDLTLWQSRPPSGALHMSTQMPFLPKGALLPFSAELKLQLEREILLLTLQLRRHLGVQTNIKQIGGSSWVQAGPFLYTWTKDRLAILWARSAQGASVADLGQNQARLLLSQCNRNHPNCVFLWFRSVKRIVFPRLLLPFHLDLPATKE
jgi:hypothetical protein